MEIINISRGQVKLKLDDNNTLIISGEAMMPKSPPELSNYVVYENSIKGEFLGSNSFIDDSMKTKIFEFLKNEFKERGLNLIVE